MCSFHHCVEEEFQSHFSEYNDTSSECEACKKRCSLDSSCAAVECKHDDHNCMWLNSTNCYESRKRLGYSERYKTCIKPPKSMLYVLKRCFPIGIKPYILITIQNFDSIKTF